jgi:hypothetical protein
MPGMIGYRPGYVPSDPRGYGGHLDQYYPNWRQDVFAGKPMPVKPGQQIAPGSPGYQQSGSMRDAFFGSDPRQVFEHESFKRLMELSRAPSGAAKNARELLQPGIDKANAALSSDDPLGVMGKAKQVGESIYQRGQGAVRDATADVVRNAREQSSGSQNPALAPFLEMMARVNSSGGLNQLRGEATARGNEAELAASQANAAYQTSMQQILGQYAGTIGGLEQQGEGMQLDAAKSASQIASFAFNTWSEILGRLFGGAASSNTYQQPQGDFEQWLTRAKQQYYLNNFGMDAQDARWLDQMMRAA